jgi:glycosyltransferase involved in cell wall biosynthesis
MKIPAYKILHINLARGWRGGEQQTWQLMQQLRKRNFAQGLCAHPKCPLAKKATEHGYTIISPRTLLICPWTGRNWDILHAHDGRGVYLAGWLNLATSRPYIITRRDPRRPSNRKTTNRIYQKAAVLVGVSSPVAGVLRDISPDSKVACIMDAHSGRQPNMEAARAFRKLWLGDAQFLVGHAGALVDKHKGQKTLITAVKSINEADKNLRLVLMGSGPDQKMLEDLADNDEKINFVGYQSPIQDALAALDLFVFPSNYEALGSVILEAMLCRVPVVATDVGGIPDLITNGRTGILFSPKDPRALGTALQKLTKDPSLRNELATNAYKKVHAMSSKSMATRYSKLYQECTLCKS